MRRLALALSGLLGILVIGAALAQDLPHFRLGTTPNTAPPPTGAPSISFSYTVGSGTVGASFSLAPNITNSTGSSPSFSLLSPLPSGLSLDPGTGAISGTPQAPFVGVTAVRASAGTAVATSNVSFTILGTLSVGYSAASGVVGTPLSVSPTVSNTTGVAPTFTALTALPPGLNVDPSTGALVGTPSSAFNGTVSIRATSGAVTADTTISVSILGNLNASYAAGTGTVGQAFSLSPTVSNSTGVAATFTAVSPLPAGLSIDSATGAITGTPSAAFNGAVTVRASAAGINADATINFQIDGTMTLAYAPVIGQVGTALNVAPSFTNTTVGTPVFSTLSPLPAGLAIDPANGAISGTPGEAFSGPVVVRVTSGSVVTEATISFSVVPVPLVVQINNVPTNPTAGTSVTMQATVTNPPSGGTITYYLEGGSTLPPGLDLNTSTGAITGVLLQSGTFSDIRIGAVHSGGASSAQPGTASVTVLPGTFNITIPTPVTVTYNQPMTATPTLTGFPQGATGLVYTLAQGTLPTGVTLDPSTGVISGTPTSAGTHSNLRITATNGSFNGQSNLFSIQVNGGPWTVTAGANFNHYTTLVTNVARVGSRTSLIPDAVCFNTNDSTSSGAIWSIAPDSIGPWQQISANSNCVRLNDPAPADEGAVRLIMQRTRAGVTVRGPELAGNILPRMTFTFETRSCIDTGGAIMSRTWTSYRTVGGSVFTQLYATLDTYGGPRVFGDNVPSDDRNFVLEPTNAAGLGTDGNAAFNFPSWMVTELAQAKAAFPPYGTPNQLPPGLTWSQVHATTNASNPSHRGPLAGAPLGPGGTNGHVYMLFRRFTQIPGWWNGFQSYAWARYTVEVNPLYPLNSGQICAP